MTFDNEGEIIAPAGQREGSCDRGVLDTGLVCNPRQQLLVEVHDLLVFRVLGARKRELRGEQMIGTETGVHLLQVQKTADQKTGTDQQHERERDLSGSETIAQLASPGAL